MFLIFLIEKISHILGKWNFLAVILKNFLNFLKRKLFLYFRKHKPRESFLYFWNRKPQNFFYIFSRESLSYISGNGHPEKILYISSNGTLLYFRWWFVKPENVKFLILFLKLKYFLVIIIKCFSHSTFFRTQLA